METRSVRLTFTYEDSSQTRIYTLSDFPASVSADIKSKVKAINSSLEAGTSGGLNLFFTDDEGNEFALISDATLIIEQETPLDLGGE